MTTRTVSRAAHATLVAGVADSVVLNATYQSITVVNRGDDFLYVTTDGTVPTVAAAESLVLPPRTSSDLPVLTPLSATAPTTTTVGVISASSVAYSVTVSPLHLTDAGPSGHGSIDSLPNLSVATMPTLTVTQNPQVWTPFRLYQGQPVTETTMYTCPALTLVEVTQVLVTASAASTWSLSVVPSGQTAANSNRVVLGAPVQPNDTATLSGLVLGAGDFLSGLLSSTSATVTVFGRRRTA